MDGEIVKHKSGASATQLDEAWNLMPFEGLQYAARRFWLGKNKHGARNWEQGDEEYAEERLKHMLRHAALFGARRQREDLEAVICNAMMLAFYYEQGLIQERATHVNQRSTKA